ncbi:hypothetical protein CK203_112333 [Vitis vinifera]|uniref:Uncharacterized protein n=1 Tax=Vitis vinifera TaxID=29760 RepID=A0A438CBR4_VITVI|nr:hypothetical protein CK203_112333 [Vitis vinifera]
MSTILLGGIEANPARLNSLCQSPMKRVIGGKYEQTGDWCSREVREGYGVGVWKASKGGWEVFNGRIGFKMGYENRVKFWKDRWCRALLWREILFELYSMALYTK